ncbi:uncharacterized skeletal organic matrix protein 2 [Exaiptasia diaphana]|uniref:UPAR/Ly6 domain-containing protein n=1 Tax=Exaiptasia diaphana TaxID=2652724 RepID=A0A913X4Y2_EXADI|nr:uncharacterized skeletal organic matrix protein 2 [Exaiptasia diaphana]KXJ27078.1 hypothetical protein AC249_AIPGENE13694 [Exaiptasia diaphana]
MMHLKLFVAIFLFAVSLEQAKALKCYGCLSTKDWSTCNSAEKEVTCASGITHCRKAEVSAKGGGADVTTYTKVCSDDCDADKIAECNKKKEGVSVSCKINCCTGDLCNAASAPLISGFIIMTCALLAAFF